MNNRLQEMLDDFLDASRLFSRQFEVDVRRDHDVWRSQWHALKTAPLASAVPSAVASSVGSSADDDIDASDGALDDQTSRFISLHGDSIGERSAAGDGAFASSSLSKNIPESVKKFRADLLIDAEVVHFSNKLEFVGPVMRIEEGYVFVSSGKRKWVMMSPENVDQLGLQPVLKLNQKIHIKAGKWIREANVQEKSLGR